MMATRALATLLFTDIVGSTGRAAELGDRGWGELLQAHHARVRTLLRRYGGREIKATGDGFLATFASPTRAIACAWSIREELREIGLEVRCGLHMGQIDLAQGDVRGMAVHVAARVAGLGAAGEILISGALHDAELGSGYRFADRGSHLLKGVPGEWRIFAVTDLAEGAKSATVGRSERLARYSVPALVLLLLGLAVGWAITSRESTSPSASDSDAGGVAPGIAVLPFQVSGAGVEDLHEGMVDLLSLNLDGAGGLRAIDSRTVLARWQEALRDDPHPDLAQQLAVARQTEARFAIIGQAIGIGPDLRLRVQVYDARTDKRLGDAEVAGSRDSMLSLVDRLTVEVLRTALKSEAADFLRIDLADATTPSIPALKAYLDGEAHFRRSEWEAAIKNYDRAIAADSTFALAIYRFNQSLQWAWLPSGESERRALRLMERYSGDLPRREALLLRAQSAAHREDPSMLRALEDAARQYPDDPEIWFMLGWNYMVLSASQHLTFNEIERPLRKAIELDPGFTPAYLPLILGALFFHRDSTESARLMSEFSRRARQSKEARALPVAFDLVFAGTDVAGVSVIDTLDLDLTWELYALLYPSTLFPLRLRLLERLDAHPEFSMRTTILKGLELTAMGRLDELLELTSDPNFHPGIRAILLYDAYAAGMPVPESRVEEALVIPSTGASTNDFLRGAFAADRGRWTEHAAAIEGLRVRARELFAQSDSSGGRFFLAAALGLDGYGLWRKGKPGEGLIRMWEAVPQAAGFSHQNRAGARQTNSLLQLWVGSLLIDLGRPREAIPFFRALRYDNELRLLPPGLYRMGMAYDSMGERDSANAAYAEFARIWRYADPALQDRVSMARRRGGN
jgi:class 3 adenylate cyclase/tetratricopeptide (TPR) repeat protein